MMTCKKHGTLGIRCGWCEDQAELAAKRDEVERLRAELAARDASQKPQMTQDRIAMLWNALPIDMDAQAIVSFVRGVERYHGIGT